MKLHFKIFFSIARHELSFLIVRALGGGGGVCAPPRTPPPRPVRLSLKYLRMNRGLRFFYTPCIVTEPRQTPHDKLKELTDFKLSCSKPK